MATEKKYRESVTKLEIKFGGANEMDGEALVASLEGFINFTKAITVGTDPESYAKIIVTPPERGSFTLLLALVVNEAHTLFTKENYDAAKTVVGYVKDIISIKKFLGGRKPKSVGDVKNGSMAITNGDGSTNNFAAGAVNQYFGNAKIDNSLVQVFINQSTDANRADFELKTADGKIVVEKGRFKEMASQIVDDSSQIVKKNNRQTVDAKLVVKMPDLAGTARWSFVFDRIIQAEVKDDAFLEKVRNGEVNFSAGSVVPCRLLIEVPFDAMNNPLPAKYTVLEVTGKVQVLKDEDTQRKLFGDHHVD